MQAVVTGSCGLLGEATVRGLMAQGHHVVGVDAVPPEHHNYRHLVGDLRDPYTIHRAIDKLGDIPDAVIHLANHRNAESGPPEVVLRENFSMNTSVVMSCVGLDITRLIFSSSIQSFLGGIHRNLNGEFIYPPRFPIDESLPCLPMNTYGLSKLLTEQMLDHICNREQFESKLSALSLRFPYLMRQRHIEAVAGRSGPTDFRWGGAEAFAYLHVDDAADAIRNSLTASVESHEVVWLAAPDPRTPETAAELARRYYPDHLGVETVYETGSFMNCNKAGALLGWSAGRTISSLR